MQCCDARVVPTWIPDGFSLTLQETSVFFGIISVYAFFEGGERKLTLDYSIATGDCEPRYYYEKSSDEVTVESIAGIDHYFFRNASQYVCCWVTDGVECFISGNIAQEELQKIVRSIYSEVEESAENN